MFIFRAYSKAALTSRLLSSGLTGFIPSAEVFGKRIEWTFNSFSKNFNLNLNGDYISDALAAQVGGIGIAPGANINYKSGHAIFEATHGTAPAPDIAGKNIANPSSLILSGVMMFEYLGWQEVAELIKIALSFSFRNGNLTADLGGKLSTSKFSDVLIDFIKTY